MTFSRLRSFLAVRSCAFVALVAAALVATGCSGVRTQMKVPACAEVTSISGEHLRYPQSVGFNHGSDFVGTQTEVVVEHVDGAKTTIVATNAVPDVFNLVGGGFLLAAGAGALTLYAVETARSQEVFSEETFLLLPAGFFVGGVGTYFLLTGWSPAEDIVIPSRCGELRVDNSALPAFDEEDDGGDRGSPSDADQFPPPPGDAPQPLELDD